MSTFAMAVGQYDMLAVIDKNSRPLSNLFINNQIPSKSSIDATSTCDIKLPINCDNIHEPYPCHIQRGDSGPYLPCRIFGPSRLIKQIRRSTAWNVYIPACLEAAYQMFGSHPFSKLDLVFLPRCFSGLGLASPSLVFLSQSLFINGGMVSETELI